MPAAASAAQLGPADLEHLDARGPQQGVRGGVAVVGEHDARLDGDRVVAAVPLLALGRVGVAAGLDDAQRRQVERAGDDVDEPAPCPRP